MAALYLQRSALAAFIDVFAWSGLTQSLCKMSILTGFECVFALSLSKGHVCIAGVRPEETVRGRVPAEDGRIVRMRALHSQPSQGLITSRHPIIPLNNTF